MRSVLAQSLPIGMDSVCSGESGSTSNEADASQRYERNMKRRAVRHRQTGGLRRVTTATPEQTQERSDERALALAKMRDQFAAM